MLVKSVPSYERFHPKLSPVQVKNSVSVYIDRDCVRDRDKNNREKNYIDRDRDAK